MPTPRSSGGDPARTLALLWRDPAAVPRHGPARGLSLDTVVETATALADRDGVDALTMRQLARALGVAPMSLYTYIPGKAELLDLMLDAAYAAMPRTDTAGQPWRQRLAVIADENRAMYRAHPWAGTIATIRPPLGPGQMAKYEHELSALDGLGLSDVERDDCLAFLLTFVQASARVEAAARDTQRDSGVSDEQWWAQAGPLLARIMDETRFPLAARVGAAAGTAHHSAHDPEHAYAFGLQRVLDGLSRLVDRSRTFPVSVKGVAIRDGRVLLLRNERDEWELPGGKLELGEDPAGCVAREINEETGWTVATGPILDSWQYHIRDGVDVLIVTYGCHVTTEIPPAVSSEHKEVGLFTADEAAALRMPDGYKKSIAAWLADRRGSAAADPHSP